MINYLKLTVTKIGQYADGRLTNVILKNDEYRNNRRIEEISGYPTKLRKFVGSLLIRLPETLGNYPSNTRETSFCFQSRDKSLWKSVFCPTYTRSWTFPTADRVSVREMVRREANKAERYTGWACGTWLVAGLLDRVENTRYKCLIRGKCLIGEMHARFVLEDDRIAGVWLS